MPKRETKEYTVTPEGGTWIIENGLERLREHGAVVNLTEDEAKYLVLAGTVDLKAPAKTK